MKRIAAGLLLYFAFLIATLPASFLDRILDHYSGGVLRLSNAEGTLWHGSGTLGISGKISGNYSWKIAVPEIFLGRLHMKFDSGMELVFRPGSIEIRHASFDLPASALSLLGKQIRAIGPGGLIHIRTKEFTLSGKSSGEISAQWENATSTISRVNPLGTYDLTIRGSGDKIGLSLGTAEGPLMLAGNGTWSERNGLKFSGTGQSNNQGIAELLRMAAPPLGGGRYALRIPP